MMTTRKTGSITQAENGRWRLRFTVREKRETIGFYDTWEDAEAMRLATIDAAGARDDVKRDGVLLKKYGYDVLLRRQVNREVRNPDGDWSLWNNHIADDPIVRLPIKLVKPRHINEFLRRMRERMEHQSMLNAFNVIRVIFRDAHRREVVKDNPCTRAHIPAKPAVVEEPWTFLEPHEQRALIDVTPEPLRFIVSFAIHTGLRAGELVALRLVDVRASVAEPVVVVRYGKPPAEPTKGKRIREVPLFAAARDAALAWIDQLPRYAPQNPNGLMFPRPDGGFRDRHHVLPWETWAGVKEGNRKRLKPRPSLVELAGIARNVRWHDLRHTCASSLVSGWWGRRWSLEEVMKVLGHSAISVTMRYAHLADSALKQAARETHGNTASTDGPSGDRRAVLPAFSGFPPTLKTGGGTSTPSASKDAASHAISASAILSSGPSWSSASDRVLSAVREGRGEDAVRAGEEFARAVLGADVVRAAHAVLAGGPHALDRALDLVELLRAIDAGALLVDVVTTTVARSRRGDER